MGNCCLQCHSLSRDCLLVRKLWTSQGRSSITLPSRSREPLSTNNNGNTQQSFSITPSPTPTPYPRVNSPRLLSHVWPRLVSVLRYELFDEVFRQSIGNDTCYQRHDIKCIGWSQLRQCPSPTILSVFLCAYLQAFKQPT